MTFDRPVPFTEAIEQAVGRELLPTALSSAEIRAALDARVRRQALFSARTTSASYLQTLRNQLAALLQPGGESGATPNFAAVRAQLQAALDDLGYTPEEGFSGDTVPPAAPGSLRDLSSQRRLDLILETQTRMAQNYGRAVKGNTPQALEQFPAWELVRVQFVAEPRGDWENRFVAAGGTLRGGRMIARKDDPVWQNLGNIADDSLGNPYPPFAFNSGMGWRDVDRAEAVRLGVIAENELPAARDPEWESNLQEVAAQYDPDLLRQLEEQLNDELVAWDTGEVLQEELTRRAETYANQ